MAKYHCHAVTSAVAVSTIQCNEYVRGAVPSVYGFYVQAAVVLVPRHYL